VRRWITTACAAVALMGGLSSLCELIRIRASGFRSRRRSARATVGRLRPDGDRCCVSMCVRCVVPAPSGRHAGWSVVTGRRCASSQHRRDHGRHGPSTGLLAFNGSGAGATLWALPLASPTWTNITPLEPVQPRPQGRPFYTTRRGTACSFYGGGRSIGTFLWAYYSETWQVPFGGAPSWSGDKHGGHNTAGFASLTRDLRSGSRSDGDLRRAHQQSVPTTGIGGRYTLFRKPQTWSQIIPTGPIPPPGVQNMI
jgi:hypothetical protein